MFFGRSLVLLLVALFGLTGAQMVVYQIGEVRRGVVLSENDSNVGPDNSGTTPGHNRDEPAADVTQTVTPAVTVAPATFLPADSGLEQLVVTTPAPTETPAPTPTASQSGGQATISVTAAPTTVTMPTIVITPGPIQTTTTSGDGTQTTTMTTTSSGGTQTTTTSSGGVQTTTTQVQSSTGAVVTTTTAVDRSTGETVRQIVRKFGIRTAPPSVPTVAPEIKEAVRVVEEKTAGEILSQLSSIRGETDIEEVRLRYRFVNGKMTLVGETDTGQESLLTASESASILARLQRSAAPAVFSDAPGEMVFSKGEVRAVTELPLLVDLRTNLLTTETSTGIKTVPLLPDEAIKIAFASKVVDGIYPKKSSAEIEFKEADNGRLIYP